MEKTINVAHTLALSVNYNVEDYDARCVLEVNEEQLNVRNVSTFRKNGKRGKIVCSGSYGFVTDTARKLLRDRAHEYSLPAKGKAGRIVRSGRLFGVELELTRGRDTASLHSKRLGGMRVKNDGSVNGESIEITTPPMSGTTAEYAFRHVMVPALNGARTDTSCGMHIHIDARDFKKLIEKEKFVAFRRLNMLYMSVQRFMFSVMPASRRNNTYCKRMNNKAIYSLLRGSEPNEAMDIAINNISRGDRYQWYNLVPFYKDGHYEIRLHGGTHETRKVLEWANLHTAIADAAMHGSVTQQDCGELIESEPEKQLEILARVLRLSDSSVKYWASRIKQYSVCAE